MIIICKLGFLSLSIKFGFILMRFILTYISKDTQISFAVLFFSFCCTAFLLPTD